MWFTAHALTGMALATRIESLPLLGLTGLGSHVLLDMIPHRDTPSPAWTLLDIGAGCLAGYFLWKELGSNHYLLWGAFFACCPDIEVLLKEGKIVRTTWFPSHTNRVHGKWSSPWGILPNLFTGLISYFIALYR